jgi:hypothetical protein
VARLAVRPAAKAPSSAGAGGGLRELAGAPVSAPHLQRLCGRVGRGWAPARGEEGEPFRQQQLRPGAAAPPPRGGGVRGGGRGAARAAGAGRGVHAPAGQEAKGACCLSPPPTARALDPQPEPPPALPGPPRVARPAAERKARRWAGAPREGPGTRAGPEPKEKRRRCRRERWQPQKLVRAVVASTAGSDTFGGQVAAEVQRRRRGEAGRKARVRDGPRWSWTTFLLHLLPRGLVGALDVLPLAMHPYAAAQAVGGPAGGRGRCTSRGCAGRGRGR